MLMTTLYLILLQFELNVRSTSCCLSDKLIVYTLYKSKYVLSTGTNRHVFRVPSNFFKLFKNLICQPVVLNILLHRHFLKLIKSTRIYRIMESS